MTHWLISVKYLHRFIVSAISTMAHRISRDCQWSIGSQIIFWINSKVAHIWGHVPLRYGYCVGITTGPHQSRRVIRYMCTRTYKCNVRNPMATHIRMRHIEQYEWVQSAPDHKTQPNDKSVGCWTFGPSHWATKSFIHFMRFFAGPRPHTAVRNLTLPFEPNFGAWCCCKLIASFNLCHWMRCRLLVDYIFRMNFSRAVYANKLSAWCLEISHIEPHEYDKLPTIPPPPTTKITSIKRFKALWSAVRAYAIQWDGHNANKINVLNSEHADQYVK